MDVVGHSMKLTQGDCLELLKTLSDNTVDCVVTDPPYELNINGGGIYNQPDKQYINSLSTMKDGFSTEILDELVRVMKKINIYLFCSQRQILPLLKYFVEDKHCNWD